MNESMIDFEVLFNQCKAALWFLVAAAFAVTAAGQWHGAFPFLFIIAFLNCFMAYRKSLKARRENDCFNPMAPWQFGHFYSELSVAGLAGTGCVILRRADSMPAPLTSLCRCIGRRGL